MTPELRDLVVSQRWFGAKSRPPKDVEVRARIELGAYAILVVDAGGDLYQVPVDASGADAVADPGFARALVAAMREGRPGFVALDGFAATGEDVRPLGVEQSNSSVVLDASVVLKVLRRLAPGVNPELEMLRFLTEHGFAHIAPLRGYYEHEAITLGVAQDFLAGSRDGWALALEALAGEDPMAFAEAAEELGAVTGALHTTLGSDAEDPAFAPTRAREPDVNALAAEIEALMPELRGRVPVATVEGTREAGRAIRHHGDYHLGQVIRDGDERWAILDFEGEPARSLPERRAKRSPLRDVAGMLRSFAYAASASGLLHGTPAPEGWEDAIRAAFLRGYLSTADRALLPDGDAAIARATDAFELEKLVYELRYELDHRPDWVVIPVAGIMRLVDAQGARND